MGELAFDSGDEKFFADAEAGGEAAEAVAVLDRGEHGRGERGGACAGGGHFAHGGRVVEFRTDLRAQSVVGEPTVEFATQWRFAGGQKDRKAVESGARTVTRGQGGRGHEMDIVTCDAAAEEDRAL